MATRRRKPTPPAPVAGSILLFREELGARTLPTGFVVPAWVLKDRALYERVRRKSFPSQIALDEFLAYEAIKRHRIPTRFAARDRNRTYFNPESNKDMRRVPATYRVPRATLLARIADLEAKMSA